MKDVELRLEGDDLSLVLYVLSVQVRQWEGPVHPQSADAAEADGLRASLQQAFDRKREMGE